MKLFEVVIILLPLFILTGCSSGAETSTPERDKGDIMVFANACRNGGFNYLWFISNNQLSNVLYSKGFQN